MRKGFWYAALLGTVSFTFGSVGFEPWCGREIQTANAADQTGSVQYFSRSGQTSTTGALPPERAIPFNRVSDLRSTRQASSEAPAVNNYHKELFGSEPDAGKTAKTEQPLAASEARPETAKPRSSRYTFQLDDAVLNDGRGVKQAGFTTDSRRAEESKIQQVGARSEERSLRLEPAAHAAPEAAAATVPAMPKFDATELGAQQTGLKIQWVKQGAISVGEECSMQLVVSNEGSATAHEVEVDASFPKSIRLTKAEPKPTVSGNTLTWNLGELNAGTQRAIQISLIPSSRGELATSAVVRSTAQASAKFLVEEPLLQVRVQGPTEVMIGDPASQLVTVTNPGTGVATNVRIEAVIPEGLEHLRGERLVMEVGSLGAGESRTVRLALAALTGGAHVVSVEARSDSGLRDASATRVNVLAPSLAAKIDGPGLRYKGRQANYVLTVTNDGSVATNNVRAAHKVPEGFTFVSASDGGQWDAATRTVSWFVGRLEAGADAELHVELTADSLGTHTHVAQAMSEHGLKTIARSETKVDGAASLVIDVVDLDDPVEVGVETAYEVTITNDGTLAAEHVSLSCQLPEGVQLSRVEAPTSHTEEERTLAFKPISSIAPGRSLKFRVFVTGATSGTHRFKAELTSSTIRDPLLSEQLTKFYGE